MQSWHRFLVEIQGLPTADLRNIIEFLASAEIDDFKPMREAVLRNFEAACGDGEGATYVALAAMRLGAVAAHAYLPQAGACFAVEPLYWSVFARHSEAMLSAQYGRVRLTIDDFTPQTLEADLANRSLLVSREDVAKLLRLRVPSLAQIDRVSGEIVRQHQAAFGCKMLKRNFIADLMRRAPRCSRESAKRAWAKHAPAEWRKQGRPKLG